MLAALTRAPGELVTREQLQAELWPAQTEVEYEQGLNAAINRLRDALGDSAAEPKFIETLPRRGYRFIGKLEAPARTPQATRPLRPAAVYLHHRPTCLKLPARSLTRIVMAAAAVVGSWRSVVVAAQDEVAAPKLAPFTALAGEERAPAFSPDGTRSPSRGTARRVPMASTCSSKRADRSNCCNSRSSRPVTQRRLVAGRHADRVRAARRRRCTGIYLVPALGGAERRLASASFPNEYFMQLAWSPDGRRIAYSSYDSERTNGIRFVENRLLAVAPLNDAPECWTAGLPA